MAHLFEIRESRGWIRTNGAECSSVVVMRGTHRQASALVPRGLSAMKSRRIRADVLCFFRNASLTGAKTAGEALS